jgi:hypothetical protein
MASDTPGLGRSNEFVLDEDLEEDDEDVLAFEAKRRPAVTVAPTAAPPPEAARPTGFPATATRQHPCAVVVDGMPADANRAHLEAFLQGCGDVAALKVYRFPDKTLAARVEFAEEAAADAALALHGKPLIRASTPVTVARAPDDWNEYISAHPSRHVDLTKPPGLSASNPAPFKTSVDRGAISVGNTGIPANFAETLLQNTDGIKSAFWSAFASAKHAASVLEQRARAAGTELDSRLHVAENVDEMSKRSRAAAELVDEKLKVRETVGSAVDAGKVWTAEAAKGARAVDDSYGITRRLSELSTNVAAVGSKAAQEVDENLRVSERAREAANTALRHETIGPVVKQAITQLDGIRSSIPGPSGSEGFPVSRKKSYPSRGVEDPVDEATLQFGHASAGP